jgi:hypothetical protein
MANRDELLKKVNTLFDNDPDAQASAVVINEPPLIMVWEDDKATRFVLHPPAGLNHSHYGMLVCDLVRHIANHFGVPESEVWYCVDEERRRPTTEVELSELPVREVAEFVTRSTSKKGNGNDNH